MVDANVGLFTFVLVAVLVPYLVSSAHLDSLLSIAQQHWSEWNHWSHCSVSCGKDGQRTRHRKCIHPTLFGDSDNSSPCDGHSTQHKTCHLHCPVDGHYSAWGSWSHCSVSCGSSGLQSRHRTCSHPAPAHGGRDCHAANLETRTCNNHCAVNGHWARWSGWSSCSVSCGHTGHQTRHRSCSNPAPAYGGHTCPDSSSGSRTCNIPCPVNGHWAGWSGWSSCSVSCGHTGHQTRHRSCSNPTPAYGGHTCPYSGSDSRTCSIHCPVNGHWAGWSVWSSCSVSCGHTGHQTRHRSCSNPGPSYGGHTCPDSSSATRSCSIHCPVNGHWAGWSGWSPCSVSCGHTGHQTRHRSCSNPTPAYGGHTCPESSSSSRTCNIPCPVNGGWGSWTHYGACSVSCCNGTEARLRSCDHPAPSHGGSSCHGNSKHTRVCSNPCTGDARWLSWTHWSGCTATCGGGRHHRTRTCAHQSICTGACKGLSRENSPCNTNHCPVDGGWGAWQTWSTCSHTCGNDSIKTRHRSCDHPTPAHGGKSCTGNTVETTTCNSVNCPQWSAWLYTPCSVTCGTGSKQGMRRCSSGHEEDCAGSAFTTESCTDIPCPVDGGWGNWKTWGTCSLTCGDGTRTRQRSCDHPTPTNGGHGCQGNAAQTGTCYMVDCPTWGNYYETSPCSVSCGQGVIQIQRNCSTGHGNDCTGKSYDEKPCTRPTC